jgi:hypothetical protein
VGAPIVHVVGAGAIRLAADHPRVKTLLLLVLLRLALLFGLEGVSRGLVLLFIRRVCVLLLPFVGAPG